MMHAGRKSDLGSSISPCSAWFLVLTSVPDSLSGQTLIIHHVDDPDEDHDQWVKSNASPRRTGPGCLPLDFLA